MSVRRLAPPDAAAYRALMLAGYAGAPDAFTSTVDERVLLPLSFWEKRLDPAPLAHEVVFGAFIGESLCGAVGVSFHQRPKEKHKAWLFGLYVAGQARGRGFGRQLVEAAVQAASERPGVLLIQLTVTEGNPQAQAVYARCGFVEFGVEPMAVKAQAGYRAKIHMWRRLGAWR